MKIDGFTISYAFDAGEPGRKSSNFVSVNFKMLEPTSIDEVECLRLEASKTVSVWAIQDALMRGEISSNDAKERIEIIKTNFNGMKSSIEKKKENHE